MLYKWDERYSSIDMNKKKGMPMRAGNKPQERERCYERNEDDIITIPMSDMIMGTWQAGMEERKTGEQVLLITGEATELYLMELRKIFVRKLLATCTSFSEGIF